MWHTYRRAEAACTHTATTIRTHGIATALRNATATSYACVNTARTTPIAVFHARGRQAHASPAARGRSPRPHGRAGHER
jgi:hypothetical protein